MCTTIAPTFLRGLTLLMCVRKLNEHLLLRPAHCFVSLRHEAVACCSSAAASLEAPATGPISPQHSTAEPCSHPDASRSIMKSDRCGVRAVLDLQPLRNRVGVGSVGARSVVHWLGHVRSSQFHTLTIFDHCFSHPRVAV
jgi:hypothetical protein